MLAEPVPVIVLGLVGLVGAGSVLLPVLVAGLGVELRKATRLVFALLGAASLLGGACLFLGARRFVGAAARARGEVVRVAESRGTDPEGRTSVAYAPVVRFLPAPDGPPAEFTGAFSDPPSHAKGDAVDVLYLPGDPTATALIGSFGRVWLPGALFVAVGAALLAVALPVYRPPVTSL